MRERRLGKALFLIACALCSALLFRMMRKLPDIRNKNGLTYGIHQILLIQAEKTVAPVIPCLEEMRAWNLAEDAVSRDGENLADRENEQGEDDGTKDGTALEEERITDDGETWEDGRITDDGETREDGNLSNVDDRL